MLTITLGTPIGKARMAAVPIVVPADPPMAMTPATLPSAWARAIQAAAPRGRGADRPRRDRRRRPACRRPRRRRQTTARRGTSAATTGGARQPASTSCALAP